MLVRFLVKTSQSSGHGTIQKGKAVGCIASLLDSSGDQHCHIVLGPEGSSALHSNGKTSCLEAFQSDISDLFKACTSPCDGFSDLCLGPPNQQGVASCLLQVLHRITEHLPERVRSPQEQEIPVLGNTG